jgi:endonuclease/exonuclease/phosphatase family metal-dependent hydrolase
VKPFVLLLLLAAGSALGAEPIAILSWNVESGGADPAIISDQLGELPDATIYALQEVGVREMGRYGNAIREARGPSYRFLGSWTGQGDRLLIVFDEDRLRLLESRELYAHQEETLNDWRHRSPLVCLFEDRSTGEHFFVVTVHLARGNEDLRLSQAKGLSSWAAESDVPTIAVGDFNFDYDFQRRRGNRSFQAIIEAGVWSWAQPDVLVDTNWSDADRDGVDNYPDSCLDFAFTANMPEGWAVDSEVIVREGDFPDDERTSDHRPIFVTLRN